VFCPYDYTRNLHWKQLHVQKKRGSQAQKKAADAGSLFRMFNLHIHRFFIVSDSCSPAVAGITGRTCLLVILIVRLFIRIGFCGPRQAVMACAAGQYGRFLFRQLMVRFLGLGKIILIFILSGGIIFCAVLAPNIFHVGQFIILKR
jgi:hypothetical protein